MNKDNYIYIISENFVLENNQKWIIDVFAKEFIEYSGLKFTQDINTADIVWVIGYELDEVKKINNLSKKPFVITTIHHIDWSNSEPMIQMIKILDNITHRYHVICDKVEIDLRTLTEKPIVKANFWINENNFYKIENKEELRKKWNLDNDKYIVGSFQRDTRGKSKCVLPKMSKGPDIFFKVIRNMKRNRNNIVVLLTGRRRNYIISELEKASIKYIYHEMVSISDLNELYNCLDLYIVSSRVEGGPRSIMECGLSKTPIISTDVGIASLIMNPEGIYDMNDIKTYKNAEVDVEYVYEKTKKYSICNYMKEFIQKVMIVD
jgi:glycosyltransferase involved in cell wall biosynthesis